jgi:FG-GAP repeat protein
MVIRVPGFCPLFASVVAVTGLSSSAHAQCEVAGFAAITGGVDDFGRSVSIGDDVAVIGDPRSPPPGRAIVFRRNDEIWVNEAELSAPLPQLEDSFGHSVSIDGERILIGAPGSDALGFQSGAACLFTFDHETSGWLLETTLLPSDGDAGDIFGYSVSLAGDVALIGDRDDENNGVLQSGSAYVFRNVDGRWVEEARLVDAKGQELDLFGVSVSIDGPTALVGAHGNDDPGLDSGAAFLFRHIASDWVFEAELTPSDAGGQERFGFSVSLAGDVAVCPGDLNGDCIVDDGDLWMLIWSWT